MTEKRIQRLKRKLQEARFQILAKAPEFSELLYSMLYVAVEDIQRISTNGSCIFVNPDWLQGLPVVSLEVMLAHQIMHIELGHIDRPRYYAGDRYHLACDIVANSHLRAMGYEYDALPRVGKLYHTTFHPVTEGIDLTAEEAFRQVPFDPAALRDKKDVRYVIDSETYWDRKEDRGEHGVVLLSPQDEDPEDLRIDSERLINKEKKHGFLRAHPEDMRARSGLFRDKTPERRRTEQGPQTEEQELAPLLESLRRSRKQNEHTAAADAEHRIWQKPNDPQLDWRYLLDSFLQEELCDYSFLPPDKRQQDSEFFLPDFNETTLVPLDILFAVDTSGSIDEEQLTEVYAEISGAIEQFNNQLNGILIFFDTRVYPPIRFSEVGDLGSVTPTGGGGTDFSCLFRYVSAMGLQPASIVIFTDGQGEIPDESAAENIPVLWLLSRKEADITWGKRAVLSRSNSV